MSIAASNSGLGPNGRSWYPGRSLLLLLTVSLPTAYRLERGALLIAGFALLLLAQWQQRRTFLAREVVLWTLGCCAFGTALMLWGGLNGTPGVPRVGTVYVLWPLICTMCVAAFASLESQKWASGSMLLGLLFIATFAVIFVLVTAGFLPASSLPPLDLNQSISLSGGFVEISFYSLNSLVFIAPFSIAVFMTWQFKSVTRATITGLLAALGTIVALLSGRRALQLVVVLAPATVLVLALLAPTAVRVAARRRFLAIISAGAVALLGAIAVLIQVIEVDYVVLAKSFAEGFEQSSDVASNPRSAQLDVLLKEWSENPLFGAGIGAAAAGVTRSYEQPWAYELSYVALLFQIGIVGLAFYVVAIGWVMWRGISVIRADGDHARIMIPMLTGLISFLIANATNPYLAAFDYLWTLFLPVAVINGWLLRRDLTRTLENRN